MANPTNAGIGTGAAQVIDTSRLDRAMYNAFETINAKNAASDEEKKAKQAKLEKAAAELRGENKFDTSHIRVQEYDAITKAARDLTTEFQGQWQDMANGGVAYNAYRVKADAINKMIAESADMKVAQVQMFTDIQSNELMSDAKKSASLKMITAVGANPDVIRQSGYLNRDEVRADYNLNIKKQFPELDVFYNMDSGGYTNAEGGGNTFEYKKIILDSEAIPKFKESLGKEEILDISIKFSGIDPDTGEERTPEKKFEKAYHLFKETTLKEMDKSTTKDNPIDKTLDDKKTTPSDFTLTPYETKSGGKVVSRGVKIVKSANKEMKPFDIVSYKTDKKGNTTSTTESIVPSGIEYKNGKWYMDGYATKSVYDPADPENAKTIRGDDRSVAMTENGQLAKEYKIRNGLNVNKSLDYHFAYLKKKESDPVGILK